MGEISDCSGACRGSGTCTCGAIVNDALVGKRVVRVGLAFSDAATATKGTAMQTALLDAPVIDAEAAKPDYAWARGRMHVDGTPLDKHYARLNLLRASPAGQRVEAARDQMIHDMNGSHVPEEPVRVDMDNASAYAAMCDNLENAWRRP